MRHDEPDFSRLAAAPVDPSEALHKPLEGNEIAHHVIGVEIDTDLACRGGDEKGGPISHCSVRFPGDEAKRLKALFRLASLTNAPGTDEQFGGVLSMFTANLSSSFFVFSATSRLSQ